MNYFTAPANYATIDIPVTKLPFVGAILFGSRALNVGTATSDYDFAILHSNLDKLLQDTLVDLNFGPLSRHFNYIPSYGQNYILKGIKFKDVSVDLLILEHQEHIDMISNATAFVKEQATLLLLKDKTLRTGLYKEALRKSGFVKNTWWRRMLQEIDIKVLQ